MCARARARACVCVCVCVCVMCARVCACMSENAKATASRFYYCYLSVQCNLGAMRPRRIKFRLAPHSQGQSHSVLSLLYPFKPASFKQWFPSQLRYQSDCMN